jgi:peptide/nickel transport system substrate-binding protein
VRQRWFCWLIILIIVMAACDSPQSAMRKPPVNSPLIGNYSYTPSSSPTPHGTLTFADIQFPDTVNPLFSSSSVDLELQAALWGAPVIYDQHFHVHADELTEVPLPQNGDVLDDGKTIIMHLRHDLRWSDGQPILANDFRYWWQLDQDPATGATNTFGYDQIASITTPDNYTVVLHMKQPFGPYLFYLPYAAPQHAWGHLNHIDLQNLSSVYLQPTVTSGPYKVVSMIDGQSYSLVPNPYYRSTTFHGPFLAHLIYRAAGSAAQLSIMARQQQADVTMGYLSNLLPSLPALSNLPADVRLLQVPAAAYEHLDFNNGEPLFRDEAVRRAIALALNVCGMLAAVLHDPTCHLRATQVEPPPSLVYDPTIQVLPYDPAQAKLLLAQAGWHLNQQGLLVKQGQPLRLKLATTSNDPVRRALVAWITRDLAAIGIQVEAHYYDDATLFGLYTRGGILATGRYDLALFSYANSPEPDDEYAVFDSSQIPSTQSPDLGNYARVADPLIDQALMQGRTSVVFAQRVAAYHRFLQRMAQQLYIIPLCLDETVMTADARTQGIIPNPNQFALTWNIADWSTATP